MPTQSKAKGNPAAHRMSNPNRTARRARCQANTKKNKALRQKLQEARAKHNQQLRSLGQPTAWDVACAERRAQRDALRTAGQLARSAHTAKLNRDLPSPACLTG